MATYIKIASATISAVGGAASIGFSSIPSTYTDLVFVSSIRNLDSNNGTAYIKINTSTANFTYRHLYGSGSAAASGTGTNETGVVNPNNYTASTFSNSSIYFPNYAGSTNKSFSSDSVNENNATTAYGVLMASLWSQTTAINAIELYPFSGNFAQYSTATLYGISKS